MNVAPPLALTAGPKDPLFRSVPPFSALRALIAVGRTGNLRRAALALNVHHAVLSRHIKMLEDRLGVPLIERLRSGVRLTPQGLAYYEQISAAFVEMSAATERLLNPQEDVRLKIACNHGFASLWLAHHLGDFFLAHPNFDIEVDPSDSGVNLKAREADAEIRFLYGDATPERRDPGVRSTEISRPDVFAVASPGFLADYPAIHHPSDLFRVPLLLTKTDVPWRRWFELQGVQLRSEYASLHLWHSDVALEAARSGQGVALASTVLLDDDLEAGRLVKIAGAQPVAIGAYHFVTRFDRWREPALLAFRNWLYRSFHQAAA